MEFIGFGRIGRGRIHQIRHIQGLQGRVQGHDVKVPGGAGHQTRRGRTVETEEGHGQPEIPGRPRVIIAEIQDRGRFVNSAREGDRHRLRHDRGGQGVLGREGHERRRRQFDVVEIRDAVDQGGLGLGRQGPVVRRELDAQRRGARHRAHDVPEGVHRLHRDRESFPGRLGEEPRGVLAGGRGDARDRQFARGQHLKLHVGAGIDVHVVGTGNGKAPHRSGGQDHDVFGFRVFKVELGFPLIQAHRGHGVGAHRR